MSIISDALRKSAQEKQAAARALQPHETSTSGRWKVLRELKAKNAELHASLREAGKNEDSAKARIPAPDK